MPEIGVGRLVETPTDIARALANFTSFHGTLDPRTALSTGYDFLSDGAEAVADELTVPRGRFTTVDPLINDTWTRDDLRSAWLGNGSTGGADVASVNAHFDHHRALPADQDASGRLTDPFTLDDVSAAADGTLDGSIVFSMGCHMGLSVSDISVGGSLGADWAQTLSGEGAIVAGNTGYGYGDDTVVGATEELMRQFAQRLDGSMTVGESMAFAKQQYAADLLARQPVRREGRQPGRPLRPADVPPRRWSRLAPPSNPPTRVDPVTGLDSLTTSFSLSDRCRRPRARGHARRHLLLGRGRDPGDAVPAGPTTRVTGRHPAGTSRSRRPHHAGSGRPTSTCRTP